MSGYVSNQNEICTSIMAAIARKDKFSIVKGISGSGKSFLVNSLCDLLPNVNFYLLCGDNYSRDRSYYPFRNLLNNLYANNRKDVKQKVSSEGVMNAINKASSFLPLGADFFSTCISEMSGAAKKQQEIFNISFNSDELELLFPLEYFCGNEKLSIFIVDDLQYWDEKSLQFLYNLVKNKDNPHSFLKKTLIVATINTSHTSLCNMLPGLEQQAMENIYTLAEIDVEQYRMTLDILGCSINLEDKLISALYSITGGNLQLTKDIVLLLNYDTDIENTVQQIISRNNLGHLVVERLNQTGDEGILINEALKYGSLFGNSFYYHDLEPALNMKESVIRKLIKTAQNLCLVTGSPSSVSFIHELIRETYKNETDIDRVKYYTGFANCLKLLHPSDYRDRSESLFIAGEYETAQYLYLLEFIKELRNYRYPIELPRKFEYSKRLIDFSKVMLNAYRAFNDGIYRECFTILEGIEDIYPSVLLAEKYYLMSITLSKWLDTRSRILAKSCLEPFLNLKDVDSEIDLWERIISAYIVACVHNNDITRALDFEKELLKSIQTRIDFDMNASFRLNTLRRKASSLYPPAHAYQVNCSSKDFFAPNITQEYSEFPLNPVEYYMSLNNYIATALMAGKSHQISQDASVLINLPQKFNYINFPRQEMPLNNAILISFFNKNITAEEALRSLLQITDECTAENSTSIILRINISIFTALNGNFSLAYYQLQQVYDEIVKIDNLEYYYFYLAKVNLVTLLFVTEEQTQATLLLEELISDELLHSNECLELHADALHATIQSYRGEDKLVWYSNLMQFPKPSADYNDYWNYYGYKYLFGELEFWSES